MSARVFIGDTLVGELHADLEAGESSFVFDAGYASSASRPVLGRWFEDRIIDPPFPFRGAPLPHFFRNLLPEGALRKIVERRLGSVALPEYTMLLRLGENLPGAVRVESDELDMEPIDDAERKGRTPGDPFRFALTGVQPKLTLADHDDRWTVPVEGAGGYWIAKLGSPAFQRLVENEYTMLEWASACGLDVPERRIIHAREIENFPSNFEPDQRVLIVRRFDRGEHGARVHQEDFAQVFDIAPEERYTWEVPDLGSIHYGSIGAVINAVCGADDHREYLRRLVFMVLSGNADAHAKNWALVYPDGLKARLAPVYDFVSTVVYPAQSRHSALRWWEPPTPTLEPDKPLAEVTLDDVFKAASHASGAATPEVLDDLAQFAAKVRETWPDVAASAPAVVRERVEAHLAASLLG